ncbi:MAG: cysteine desulfurase family protein [Clostridia bacterium]|nr:cysteine desulfurase family protein [Clostridia bacterium]
MKTLYFDNSATTVTDQKVMEAIAEYNCERYFNPSSNTSRSIEVAQSIRTVKDQVLNRLGAHGNIIFTSGGTESDNLAILGSIKNNTTLNIVTSRVEHPAVFNTINSLKSKGFDIRYVDVEGDGHIEQTSLEKAVNDKTQLVAIMHVNNESGAINDVYALSKAVKAINKNALFFSDGVQAYGRIDCRLDKSQVDLYSISAHKIHGGKGCGALFVKDGVNLNPIIFGGGQQANLRSGTENVPSIMGLGIATELAYSDLERNSKEFARYKSTILSGLEGVDCINLCKEGCPSILSLLFRDIKSEILQHILEDKYGIIVGIGSACNSKNKFDRVLAEIGVPKDYIEGLVRISFCKFNTAEDVSVLTMALRQEVCALQKVLKGKNR